MTFVKSRWRSERTQTETTLCRWGHFGQPVLIFPTAGGDAEEIERFLLIRVLDPLISAGKIRYIGCSNYAGWMLVEAMWTSRREHLAPFVSVQPEYNLLSRGIERELVPMAHTYGLALIPWSPLARGFLAGNRSRDDKAGGAHAATARAQVRAASGPRSVPAVRSIRQSGSLSHSRRCIHDRVRVLVRAWAVAGWVPR